MIYLVGTKGVLPYRLVFILLIASGAFLKLEAIWILADIVNGLMAIILNSVLPPENKEMPDEKNLRPLAYNDMEDGEVH